MRFPNVFKLKNIQEREDEPKIDEKLMRDLLESLREHEYSRKNIKNLLYHYYKYFPEDFVEGMSWLKQVLSKQDIKIFIEKGILVKSEDGEMIKLGPAGLNLISMWRTETLTKLLVIITISSLLVAIASFVISINTLQRLVG